MTIQKILDWVFPATVGLIGAAFTFRYALLKVRQADDLIAKGWRCVGVDFICGPIMVPPNDESEIVARGDKPRIRFAYWDNHAVWVAVSAGGRAFGLNPSDAFERLTGRPPRGRSFCGL